MRKALRQEIRDWADAEYRTGNLLVGITGSIGTFMGRIEKHRLERVHWFDRVERELVNNGCDAALKTFHARFGPKVVGSLLRDTKNAKPRIWEAASRDSRYQARDIAHYIREGRQVDATERLRAVRMGRFTELPLVEIGALKGKLLSVEVEYYGKRKKDDKFGRTGNDGSLSDRDNGAEYKLTTWTPETAVRKLRELKEHGIVFGACCGLHVHVDMRDLPSVVSGDTWHVLQTRFGPAVQKLIPSSRHNLHYCSFDNRSSEVRYSAWNMVCLRKYGTLEWRMQGPMVRTDWRVDTRWEERVASWMRVCQCITRKLALERQATGVFGSLTDGNRPVSWKRFLELLPDDLAEWCEIRAEMLEKGESKKNAKSSAHVGDACGPVPCSLSRNFILPRGALGGWAYLISETSQRIVSQSCECEECERVRRNVVGLLVGADELNQDGLDSVVLTPKFRAICESVLATLANPPPPDAERVVECCSNYAGMSYYTAWLHRKIDKALPEVWVNNLRAPYRVSLLNECTCAICNTNRLQAWNTLNMQSIRTARIMQNGAISEPLLSGPAASLFADQDAKEVVRKLKVAEAQERLAAEITKRKDYKKRVPSIKSPDLLHDSVSAAKWAEYYQACEDWLSSNPNLPEMSSASVVTPRMVDLSMDADYVEAYIPDESDDTWLSDETLTPSDLEQIADAPINPPSR